MNRRELLRGLRSQLLYRRLLGQGSHPASTATSGFLQAVEVAVASGVVPPSHRPPVSRKAGGHAEPELRSRGGSVGGRDGGAAPTLLAEIADEVSRCQACPLHLRRVAPVAGFGGAHVRLVVAGGWLAAPDSGPVTGTPLFGEAEDHMLQRMLAAIGLTPDQVFVTNIVKCAVEPSPPPQPGHAETCLSYFRRQVLALGPECILTMGPLAAKTVVGDQRPLSTIRGTIHHHAPGPGVSIPVLATYHPSYLLRNPEMKKAAWADLQLLAKQLGR